MFESEFAKSSYIEKDNVVFHIWKKEAHFDDYRRSVAASLEMLRQHRTTIVRQILSQIFRQIA